MNNITGFPLIATIYTFALLAASFVVAILAYFQIRRQQAVVKSLIPLRKLLLTTILTIILVIISCFIILTARFYIPQPWLRYSIYILLMLFSTIIFINCLSQLLTFSLTYWERIKNVESEVEGVKK
jgi:hypothetical protein